MSRCIQQSFIEHEHSDSFDLHENTMPLDTPYIIAEIGSNWRTEALAKKQIAKAKAAGASAVKFQMFTLEELFGPDVDKTRPCYGLPRELVKPLAECCEDNQIDFLCSAFSVDGYKFVDPYVKMHKVASPEALDQNICDHLLKQDKMVIWSNGCTHIGWQRAGDIVMECASIYPAKAAHYTAADINRVGLGLSDHTMNNDLALLFRNSGCMYFEKHVDFLRADFSDSMPDRVVSINTARFAGYVKALKRKPIDHKSECANLYGRRKTDRGYFRPIN